MTSRSRQDQLIAVVGMGVAVPGASCPDEVWELLNGTRDVFSEPGERFRLADFWSADPQAPDRTYARRAGYLHELRLHHALQGEERDGAGSHGDQAVRWLRHSLLQAREGVLIDAAYRCGVYAGAWPGGSQSLVQTMLSHTVSRLVTEGREREEVQAALLEHYRYAVPLEEAAPISALRAALARLPEPVVESVLVDTACASSLYAVDLGVKALLAGDCDIAYCGGFHVLDPTASVMFAKLNGLSKTDRVRAFTSAADGTVFSDGAAAVTLKTLEQAVSDKDTIHGVLSGFGAAADGRGKSISAPNTTGQRRAILRARAVSGLGPEDIDWIIAHGTGTPAGDGVESQVISDLAAGSDLLCTSNKPVFGHTGWVAGVFSLIHALLGLRREWIPGQANGPTEEERAGTLPLHVPSNGRPFPAEPHRARVVGVSGFGFGGTNAHLLVTDRPDDTPRVRSQPAARPRSQELALVGWSAHLPGGPTTSHVRAWLRDEGALVGARFPQPYPAPSPVEVRLSRRTISAVDPCHLMALQVAARFVEAHGEIWAGLTETTGVIAAHTGFPAMLTGASLRCHARDLTRALNGCDDARAVRQAADGLATLLRSTPSCTEDSQAGTMPNVIASRITARYDLHGPTMSIDAGVDSSLLAIKTAHHYLRTGELDLALVLAVNGNGSSENGALFGCGDAGVAEGAFLLALTTPPSAEAHGWPVMARLALNTVPGSPQGQAREPRERSYLAADHALDVLRAVECGTLPCRLPGVQNDTVLIVNPNEEAERRRIQAGPADGESGAAGPRRGPVGASSVQKREAPRQGGQGPREQWLTDRYTREFIRQPLKTHKTAVRAALPRRGVVLVDCAESASLLRPAVEDADALLLTLAESGEGPMDSGTLDERFPGLSEASPHLTVVCDLGKTDLTGCLVLHDALFLVTQRLWSRWQPDSSMVVLLTGLEAGTYQHPLVALFTGFVKSLQWENPQGALLVLATDEAATPALLTRVGHEMASDRPVPPLVYYFKGDRRVETLHPSPLPTSFSAAPFPVEDGSIGVVTGGTGGITECLLTTLSAHARPKLWLLGRTRDIPLPDEVLSAPDDQLPRLRSQLMRRLRDADSGMSTRAMVAHVDEMMRARNARRVIERLRNRFGAEKVEYVSCDMRDPAAVDEAIRHVVSRDGRVDFVVHAAGQVGSTVLAKKTLETFRRVRDTKVLGHHHLKAALRAAPPRLWCNIGSHSGAAGVPGDPDYAAGNAYLEAAAEALGPTAEITIGFGMWAQAGMGADPVLQEQIARDALFTPIPTAEGTAQFLSEFGAAPLLAGASTYLGRNEKERLRKQRPGLIQPDAADPKTFRQLPSWAGSRVSGLSASATWDMDARDAYLFDHLVHGKPTTPATFMLDIAAHAAELLVPGSLTRGFRQAEFERFIRPYAGRTHTPLRIRAHVCGGPVGDDRTAAVEVSIHSDTLAPDGRLREGALRHFRALVLVTGAPVTAPSHRASKDPSGAASVADPYATDDGPVSLRGIFRNLSHCEVGTDAVCGLWTPRLTGRSYLRSTTIPPLLVCAALRTGSLRPGSSGHQPLLVPRSVERLDLYVEGANDRELLARYGHTLGVGVDGEGIYRAWTADGRLLLEVAGVRAIDMAGPPG
ncbi:SDR family oxidoreductase [Streptomyces sp. NPDC097107]|uniref:SDR family oxidoreductase n=1 Tax=Streptomyces sp. NPDC097107 TaxID=3366089 RepID=UPI0038194539